MMACTDPFSTTRSRPVRICLPSTSTCRSLISSIGRILFSTVVLEHLPSDLPDRLVERHVGRHPDVGPGYVSVLAPVPRKDVVGVGCKTLHHPQGSALELDLHAVWPQEQIDDRSLEPVAGRRRDGHTG